MKTTGTTKELTTRVKIAFVLIVLLSTRVLTAQNWYDENWQYRSAVTVPAVATALSDFQVQVNLNVGNFDFSKALSDGSDIRLTTNDGTTLIPFWIESWTSATASIWVKVPSIPVSGTTIYMYYGNVTPSIPTLPAVEAPPIGPFTRSSGNPIVPNGQSGTYILAENIVGDGTGRYWMVLAAEDGTINLIWSNTPTNPAAWTWDAGNPLLTSANAPHIIKYRGTWYVFYADQSGSAPYHISVASSSTINGDYTILGQVLAPSDVSPWDDLRVDEPYVFQYSDSTWYMAYMGDAGNDVEQVGYATSSSITGPYTAHDGNPVLAFGDSYDHGTIADPWVYNYNGTYYIGYTVSGIEYGDYPWKTAVATTTDWQTFTKQGVIFPLAESGWDYWNSFRGAVTRIENTYVLSYTGGGAGYMGIPYQMGIATQPVYVSPPTGINDPDAVFDFYDSFNGSALNTAKWTVMNNVNVGHAQPPCSDGVLTLHTLSGFNSKLRIFGNISFGMNFIEETKARHLNQGTTGMFMQVGFVDFDFLNMTRILDDDPDLIHWQRLVYANGGFDNISMNQDADTDWHIFRVFRQGSGAAGFQIDESPTELVSEHVPTISLPPYVDSYGPNNEVNVDWFRIRKWAGSDPVTVVGPGLANGQNQSKWTGETSTDWNNPGNWESESLPGSTDYITIPDVVHDPLSTDLTIGSSASLNVEVGGALTVTGNLINNGSLTIQSSGLTLSGSLIVNGTSTGDVTYNRQMRTEADDGDYHYFSSPVALNSATNSGKVTTVYQYNEVTNHWSTLPITSLQSGIGYNLDQTTASDGLISFTGPVATTDPISINATSPYRDVIDGTLADYSGRVYADGTGHSGITRDYSDLLYGGGGWNMLGNPYTSAILVSDFITANLTQFDPNYVAVYLYDGTSTGHTRYYYIGGPTGWGDPISQTHVQVGQGFFVLAMNDYSTFIFNKDMQDHSTGAVMLKSAGGAKDRWPGLQLKVKAGENENMTTIIFNEDMTVGLDPGYDVGLMSYNPGAGIYTALVEDNGINFARQALPVNGSVKNIIPVGIDFENGGKVTFSADVEPLRNYKFWLEDRTTGIFTELGTNAYSVTLPAKTYGTGRFYVHVATGRSIRPRSTQEQLHGIRVWASQNRQVNIQGVVSDRATCEVYDTFGHKIFETHLTDGDYNSFIMPSIVKGVYLVKITDGYKISTQKVVFL